MPTADGRRAFRHALPWVVYGALLVLAPLVFPSAGAVAVFSQIGCAVVFGLAYNMLLGQGGMLSFGHAVYAGLGAYVTAHAMNAAIAGTFWMPVTMAPLIGGLAGAAFGLVFGYVTTKKAGTAFAMITLGIGELVFAAAFMFQGFFGGDMGISTTRVYGPVIAGISFGPALQAYYLIAAWVFVATLAMYAFTQTPLGRMINAVRDNPERVLFVGYNPRRVRYVVLVLSSFFAGIAGGLGTLNFEIVTPETLSAAQSGMVLLFTFIGGTSTFIGPVLGAVVGTFLTISISTLTPAWPLYLGLIFILIVKFAPGGIAGLLVALWKVVRHVQFVRLAPALACVIASGAVMLAGVVLVVEMTYQLTLATDLGAPLSIWGFAFETQRLAHWGIGAALLLAGGVAFALTGRRYLQRWGEVLESIDEIRRSGGYI